MDRLAYPLLILSAIFSIFPGVVCLPRSGRGVSSGSREIVVFGDSFSDNGNAFKLTNGTWPADPAYFKGRFSNGPVWVEHVAQSLDMKLNDRAVGGATSDNNDVQGFTGPNSTIAVPSALDQVTAYLSGNPQKIHENLFIILIGGNDIFFDPNISAKESVNNIAGIMEKLENKGASKFLLASYPDLALLPYRAFNTQSGNQLLENFSFLFKKEISKLATPRRLVAYADLFDLFQDFVSRPLHYGFDPNVLGDSCLTGAYFEAPRTLCDDPDKYVFWDEFHPSAKSHQLMAQVASKAAADIL